MTSVCCCYGVTFGWWWVKDGRYAFLARVSPVPRSYAQAGELTLRRRYAGRQGGVDKRIQPGRQTDGQIDHPHTPTARTTGDVTRQRAGRKISPYLLPHPYLHPPPPPPPHLTPSLPTRDTSTRGATSTRVRVRRSVARFTFPSAKPRTASTGSSTFHGGEVGNTPVKGTAPNSRLPRPAPPHTRLTPTPPLRRPTLPTLISAATSLPLSMSPLS